MLFVGTVNLPEFNVTNFNFRVFHEVLNLKTCSYGAFTAYCESLFARTLNWQGNKVAKIG